jgi:nucleoid-associated protein YgaU
MKKYLIAAFILMATPVLAQTVVDPNKPDAELTAEEAAIRITEWRNKVNALQTRLDALTAEMNTMNADMTRISASIRECNTALWTLVGATEADVNSFRERLGRLDARVTEMSRMGDAELVPLRREIDSLEMTLNGMRREKIALLPEFYNKIIDIAQKIRGLRRTGSSGSYTVGTWAEDRDCLWNIAGKEQTYGDPLMWPKIWLANNEQIRNPDLIFPGQVLTIPPAGAKTDEELRAERLYYRRKSAARRTAVRRSESVEQQEAGSGN